jgi:hypothetical protein
MSWADQVQHNMTQHLISVGPISLILLSVSLLFSPCVGAQTQQCDSLRPLQGSQSQYKNRGNRCEGLYVADIGASKIEILSLTIGEISFLLTKGEELRVSVPNTTGTVRIRAVARPPKTYYRMDASLAPGTTLEWPVNDVLLPENISSNRIGIFAFRDDGNQRIFIPARIVAKSAHQNLTSQVGVLLAIRPSFDADSIKWRWSTSNQGICSRFGNWQDAATSSVDAGQSVNVLLSGLKGQTCVEVAAKTHGKDEWSTLKLSIEIPAS